MEGLEKERDFYFGKLRDIEVTCQENEDNEVIKNVMDILYATEVFKSCYLCFHFLSLCKVLVMWKHTHTSEGKKNLLLNAYIHFKYRTVSDTSHDVVFQSQENAPVASVYLNKKKWLFLILHKQNFYIK